MDTRETDKNPRNTTEVAEFHSRQKFSSDTYMKPFAFVFSVHDALRLPVGFFVAERHVLRHMADLRVSYFETFKFSLP